MTIPMTMTMTMTMTKTNSLLCLCSALAIATTSMGCGTSTECGPGTISVGGTCEPDLLECGEGTFELEGQCVAIDPNDQTAPLTVAVPAGGTSREAPGFVTLTTNEVATIHYTVDGTEPTTDSPSATSQVVIQLSDSASIRFFAVDPAGNTEGSKLEDYLVDAVAPEAPSLVAATADAAVRLDWTNPSDADFADVVVLRREGAPVNVAPAAGATLTVGEDLGNGNTVLYLGAAEQTVDPTAAHLVFYALFSRDSVSNVSIGSSRTAFAPAIGDQVASLTVDTAAGTVAVGTQPTDMNIVGTASLNGNTLTVDLEITSNISRLLFSPKLVVSSLSEGDLDTDGSVGEQAFVALGAALESNTARARTLTIGAVTANTVTFDIRVLDNPLVAHSQHGGIGLYDIEAGDQFGVVEIGDEGPDGSGGAIGPAFSPDGRLLAFGSRNNRVLRIVDITTLQIIATIGLGSAGLFSDGAVPGAVFSPDGRRLFAVSREGHLNNDGPNATLSEIDAETFEILRTTPIGDEGSLQRPDLSPDGRFLAIADRNSTKIHVVDVGLMEELDGDPSVSEISGFEMSPDIGGNRQSARRAIFGPQSRQVFVVFGNGSAGTPQRVLDLKTRVVGDLASAATNTASCRDGQRGADGDIWVVCNNSDERLLRYNLMSGTETIIPASSSRGGGLGLLPDGRILLISGRNDANDAVLIDPANPAEPTELNMNNRKGHSLASSPF